MFARTQRLMLRPGWREDATALAAAIGDMAVARNLSRVPHPYRVDDADAFLAQSGNDSLPAFLAFQRTAGAPRLVGGVGLHRDADGEVELGYWVARPYWGLGFATEAARAVIDIAGHALRLPRVMAGHALDNPASERVLRKLGFRATGGIGRRHSVARNGTMDVAEFVMDFAASGTGPTRLAA